MSCAFQCNKAGQGRAGQGRAGQGRAGQSKTKQGRLATRAQHSRASRLEEAKGPCTAEDMTEGQGGNVLCVLHESGAQAVLACL